jgi:hypothetical protein
VAGEFLPGNLGDVTDKGLWRLAIGSVHGITA